MLRSHPSSIGQAASIQTGWLSSLLVCLILGLAGAISMIVLTPPFQVPDEQEHFHRAYQLSELQIGHIELNGRAGGILPSSLIELSEAFLGTRAPHAGPQITAQPFHQTWMALNWPLQPERREFVDFTGTAFYSPMGYLPQALAITAGRWAGAGPLALLYLARLANALVAIALLSWAVRVMPIGREATMVVGLFPMAVFEYASVAPDAGVIGTAFLFTAVALRAQLRDKWTVGGTAVAAVSGLVFCSQRPMYAPLLVLGLPAALTGNRRKQALLAHVVILVVALGATGFWISFALSKSIAPLPGSSVTEQLSYITANPLAYYKAIATTLYHKILIGYKSLIGILGWMRFELPKFSYFLAPVALLLSVMAQPRDVRRLPVYGVVWNVFLLTGIVCLIMTAEYLIFSPVGSRTVSGAQGRHLIPLLPLLVATICSVVTLRIPGKASLALFTVVTAIVAVQILTADILIVRAYQLF